MASQMIENIQTKLCDIIFDTIVEIFRDNITLCDSIPEKLFKSFTKLIFAHPAAKYTQFFKVTPLFLLIYDSALDCVESIKRCDS